MRRRLPCHRPGEEGAYLVLYAVLAVVLFTVAALVLDITALRQDRKSSRAAADAAVTAGAAALDGTGAGSVGACEQAWAYFVANRPDTLGTITAPDCAAALASACDGSTVARTATGTAGGFRVEITNPVPATHDLMRAEVQGGDQTQGADPTHDGTERCRRIGVRVQRTRDLSLAGVAGLRSASTDVHSVALSTTAVPPSQLVALVVLDPTGCGALRTINNGKLAASATTGTGAIYVDSTGASCGLLQYVIDPADGPQDKISADGGIYSHGASVDPIHAFNGVDVAQGRLTPLPLPNPSPVGRAAVDARYGTAINALELAFGSGSGGLTAYPAAGESCVIPSGTNLLVSGDRYVDCSPLVIQGGAKLTFASSRIVIRDGIRVEANGCLAVNSNHCSQTPGARDGLVFLQSGDVFKAQGAQLALNRAFVYVAPGGAVTLEGGTPNGNDLIWRAPSSGAFEDLLLWAETASTMTIVGQKIFQLEGIIFAPGNGGLGEVRLIPVSNMPASVVQLIANRILVDGTRGGNAEFIVGPDPFRVVQAPVSTVRLIR